MVFEQKNTVHDDVTNFSYATGTKHYNIIHRSQNINILERALCELNNNFLFFYHMILNMETAKRTLNTNYACMICNIQSVMFNVILN